MSGFCFGGELLYSKGKGVTTRDPSARVAVNASGDVTFTKSPDHYYAMYYTAQVRVSGNSTVVASQSVGVPVPDAYGTCLVNILSLLNSLGSGDYTVSMQTVTPGGTTDSAESNAFSIPLS